MTLIELTKAARALANGRDVQLEAKCRFDDGVFSVTYVAYVWNPDGNEITGRVEADNQPHILSRISHHVQGAICVHGEDVELA